MNRSVTNLLPTKEFDKRHGMPIKMKVCNNAEYNESLRKRGMIFDLFDEAVKIWLNEPGSKFLYSDRLIEILAVFRYLFKYPYRQLQGLLIDYLAHQDINLPVPDYTTLCRRMAKMSRRITDHRNIKQKSHHLMVDILIDSTGINIYSTGGGHSKENSKNRRFKHFDQVNKMHVAYMPDQKKVVAVMVTKGQTSDFSVAPKLLEKIPYKISSVYADAAYDRSVVRDACARLKARQVIQPQRGAIIRKPKKYEHPDTWHDRNAAVKLINRYQDEETGFSKWKEKNTYGKRSLVEAYFGRFKTIFGFSFMSRHAQSRESELITKVRILNSFSNHGAAVFSRAA